MPEFKAVPLLYMLPPARILQHLLVNFSKFFIEVSTDGPMLVSMRCVASGLLLLHKEATLFTLGVLVWHELVDGGDEARQQMR